MNELESLGLYDQPAQKYGIFKRFSRFVNKISILLTYIKILKQNRADLFKYFNIKIDLVYRMYTVIIIPDETLSLLSVKENKFEYVFQQEVLSQITNYIKSLETYFQSIGIGKEWYGVSEIEKIDEKNYKFVVRFALFDTVKIANVVVGAAFILLMTILIFMVAGAYMVINYFL